MGSKHPWLHRRGGTYYLRAKVPKAAQAALGRAEIKVSLRTRERTEAYSRIHEKAAEVSALFYEAAVPRPQPQTKASHPVPNPAKFRRHAPTADFEPPERFRPAEELSQGELRDLARSYQSTVLQSLCPPNPFALSAGERNALIEECDDLIGMLSSGEQANSNLHGSIRLWLQAAGIRPIDLGSQTKQLWGMLLGAHRTATLQARQMLNLDYDFAVEDGLSNDAGKSWRPTTPSLQGYSSTSSTGYTLFQVVEAYGRDPNRREVTRKTLQDDQRAFAKLFQIIDGSTPVRDITRDQIRRFQSAIVALPANATQKLPGSSLEEAGRIAKERGLKQLSAKGANKYLLTVSALFRWAEKEEMIERNPAKGIAQRGAKHRQSDRMPFPEEVLQLFFQSPFMAELFKKRFISRDAVLIWAPLIALTCGLRQAECCQLEAGDFRFEQPVPLVSIREGGMDTERHVKTVASHRDIPIPAFLLKVGIEQVVQAAVKRDDKRLFPFVKRGADGHFSAFSKRFSRLLKRLGCYTELTTYHSFRHNFKDVLDRAGTREAVINYLGGWDYAQNSTSRKYGSPPPILERSEAISRVCYTFMDCFPFTDTQFDR